jgi:hypothetical protein
MQVKFKIPWKDGKPDLTQSEIAYCGENKIGFCAAENINYSDITALVYIIADDDVIEFLKTYGSLMFIE